MYPWIITLILFLFDKMIHWYSQDINSKQNIGPSSSIEWISTWYLRVRCPIISKVLSSFSPLKKDEQVEYVAVKVSFDNWRKLNSLNWRSFSHHTSFNLGTWPRRESFCSIKKQMPKNFETQEFLELCGNASISQLKQLKPLHVTNFNCNLQQNQGEGSNFKIKCNIISTMIACAYYGIFYIVIRSHTYWTLQP